MFNFQVLITTALRLAPAPSLIRMQRQPVAFRIYKHGHVPMLRRNLRLGAENGAAGGFHAVEHFSEVGVGIEIDKYAVCIAGLIGLVLAQGGADATVRENAHFKAAKVHDLSVHPENGVVEFFCPLDVEGRDFKPGGPCFHK